MSAARFVSFVKANLVGKRVHSAFVADTNLPRIVFSDGSVVECGTVITVPVDNKEEPLLLWHPTICSAESVPVERK